MNATNQITVVENCVPMVHVNKAGKTKIAYSDLMREFMPKDARMADAMERSANALQNGRYVGVLRDIAARMSDSEKVRVFEAGVSIDREKPTKSAMLPFADAVIDVWNSKIVKGAKVSSPAKGEKAAMCALLKMWSEQETKALQAA